MKSRQATCASYLGNRPQSRTQASKKIQEVLDAIGETVEVPSLQEELGDEVKFSILAISWEGRDCPSTPLARTYTMPIGIYDLETRSTINLTLSGAWTYAVHPSTAILCMYVAIDEDEPVRWLPGDSIPAAFVAASQHADDWKLIAHNHEFERAIYERS